jgi:hypothetical protein
LNATCEEVRPSEARADWSLGKSTGEGVEDTWEKNSTVALAIRSGQNTTSLPLESLVHRGLVGKCFSTERERERERARERERESERARERESERARRIPSKFSRGVKPHPAPSHFVTFGRDDDEDRASLWAGQKETRLLAAALQKPVVLLE